MGFGVEKMNGIFRYNEDIEKTAYINWLTKKHEAINNYEVLAKGYFKSAKILIEKCLDDNEDKKADIIILPIIFCMNQGIELFEKALYFSLNSLLGYKGKPNTTHDIRELWNAVKQKIIQYGFDSSAGRDKGDFNNMIRIFEKYLDELNNVVTMNQPNDLNLYITFSRYPYTNKSDEQFYIADSYNNQVVDLEQLQVYCNEIYSCLDRLSGYYYMLLKDKEK